MVAIEDLAFRPLANEDIAAARGLNAEAGWNQVAADWRRLLALGRGTAVEDLEGRLVATSMVLPHGSGFAWIAMILVTAAYRRRGIAGRLMRRALVECEGGGRVAGLDATEVGRPVYLPLGFRDIYTLSRWSGMGGGSSPAPTPEIRPVAAPDFDAVGRFDAAAFGAGRDAILRHLSARKPDLALLAVDGGEIRGFVLARDGRLATQIGPLVARDAATARALLAAQLARLHGPVFLDAADHHETLRDWLAARGFQRQRGYTRMLRRRERPLDDPATIWIIAGPEFG